MEPRKTLLSLESSRRMTRSQTQSQIAEQNTKRKNNRKRAKVNLFERSPGDKVIGPRDILSSGGKIKVEVESATDSEVVPAIGTEQSHFVKQELLEQPILTVKEEVELPEESSIPHFDAPSGDVLSPDLVLPTDDANDLASFQVFPEEVWGFVIKVCEESVIQNLFAAIPRFFKVFEDAVKILQFEQIAANVFKYNNPTEQLSKTQQLVTSEWCSAFEIFLNRHPLQQFEDTPQELTTFQYPVKPTKYQKSGFFNNCSQFYDSRGDFCLLESAYFNCRIRTNRVEFFDSTVRFLKKHGANLKHLSIELGSYHCPHFFKFTAAQQVFDLIIECLRRVPNIQSLSIILDDSPDCEDLQPFFDRCQDFPRLARLRSVCVQEYDFMETNPVLEYFLRGYIFTGQVRQLTVRNQQAEFDFTEAYHLDNISHTFHDVVEFKKHLKRNCCKQIAFNPGSNDLCHLLRYLSAEQYVVSKVLIENHMPYNSLYKPMFPLELLPSVKYLKISGVSVVNYDFLKYFPGLEYLHIFCSKRKYQMEIRIPHWEHPKNELTKLICKYLYDGSVQVRHDIWEKFSSLKIFVVQDEGMICKIFARGLKNQPILFKS